MHKIFEPFNEETRRHVSEWYAWRPYEAEYKTDRAFLNPVEKAVELQFGVRFCREQDTRDTARLAQFLVKETVEDRTSKDYASMYDNYVAFLHDWETSFKTYTYRTFLKEATAKSTIIQWAPSYKPTQPSLIFLYQILHNVVQARKDGLLSEKSAWRFVEQISESLDESKSA